jgi:DNA-binding transcriptional MerR regulator
LRYYEEKGLIASIGRRGLRRLYEPQVIERLALISTGQAAGFSLDELMLMFGTVAPQAVLDRTMLAAKADELDTTIRKLTALRNGLRHAAACRAPSHMECAKFRRIVSAAVTAARSGRRVSAQPARQGLPARIACRK